MSDLEVVTSSERHDLDEQANDAFRASRHDGLHIDPWIRTHQRLGATILGPAPHSMLITGTVSEWEEWTGMAFPETGQYVVPQALARSQQQGVVHDG